MINYMYSTKTKPTINRGLSFIHTKNPNEKSLALMIQNSHEQELEFVCGATKLHEQEVELASHETKLHEQDLEFASCATKLVFVDDDYHC